MVGEDIKVISFNSIATKMTRHNKGLILLFLIFTSCNRSSSFLSQDNKRYYDPVILKGSDVPELVNSAISDLDSIVGFSYEATSGKWSQVPIQIDEMHWQLYGKINPENCKLYGRPVKGLMYADDVTHSGPDEDGTFDSDDELVFMARFLGDRKPKSTKLPKSITKEISELIIKDKITKKILGFLYLFISNTLKGHANEKLVTYDFRLEISDAKDGRSDYKDVYTFGCDSLQKDNYYVCPDGVITKNFENTIVKTPFYERKFSENWVTDSLKIFVSGANGKNFLNMQDAQFTPFLCQRCVGTFVNGNTAFIVNKDGPVRGIREVMGANSGSVTSRRFYFYEQREVRATFFKVHRMVTDIMDLLNLNTLLDYDSYKAGVHMTFYNEHNQDGIKIDGKSGCDELGKNCELKNDTLANWQAVQGQIGTIVRVLTETPDQFDAKQWFYDNGNLNEMEEGHKGSASYPYESAGFHFCSSLITGQREAWGTHGILANIGKLPNTDPVLKYEHDSGQNFTCQRIPKEKGFSDYTIMRTDYFMKPDYSVIKEAPGLTKNAKSPLIRVGKFQAWDKVM